MFTPGYIGNWDNMSGCGVVCTSASNPPAPKLPVSHDAVTVPHRKPGYLSVDKSIAGEFDPSIEGDQLRQPPPPRQLP